MTSTTIIKPDIKGMTVADLKAFCIRKNIPIKGLKLRAQLEKAIESHTLTPIKITSTEADQLLQKSENPQKDSETQDWRDCLQHDADGNCITKAQILTPQSEKYVGEICSVVVATSAVGAVLETADGHKMYCCYPDEFKLVAGFSGAEYWECQNDYGQWTEFTHINSESAPHRKRQISRSEYDRRTQPAQPQGHNVMSNSDTNGAGGGDKKPPIVATGGAGDERDPLKLNPDRVPPYFGDRIHKADDSGQLNLLDLDEDEAPDPDDFTSHESYLAAWDEWKAEHPEVAGEEGEYPAIGSRRFASEVNLIDTLLGACKSSADESVVSERSPVERPIIFSTPMVRAILQGKKTQTRRLIKPQPQPYGPNLWLFKESENSAVVWQCSEPVPSYLLANSCPHGVAGDKLWVREAFGKNECGEVVYRASAADRAATWKPSIHMPRKVCRLILKIVGVLVERLQDISEGDVISEGAQNRKDFERLWDSIYPENDWQSNPWVWVISFLVCDEDG